MKKTGKNVLDYLGNILEFSIDNPTRALLILSVIFGIAIRIVNFMNYEYIAHPDEIFQSLEPAHKLVFGYASLPPEFQQEVPNSPYYGRARSWLFPIFFAIPMFIMNRLGFDYFTVILPTMYFLGVISSILLIFSTWYLLKIISENEQIADLTAGIVAITPHISYLSARLLTNSMLLPPLFLALATTIKLHREGKSPNLWEFLIIVFGFGIVSYIRLDLAIVVIFFAIVELLGWKDGKIVLVKPKILRDVITAVIIGWIIGMLTDYILFDSNQIIDLWQVPYNWFMFNFVVGGSSKFGVSPFGFYFRATLAIDKSDLFIFLGALTLVLYQIIALIFENSHDPMIQYNLKKLSKTIFNYLKFSIAIAISWTIYEWPFNNGIDFGAMSHKELRFILNLLVLYRLYIGFTIFLLLELLDFVVSFFKFRETEVKIRKIGMKGYYVKLLAIFIIIMFSLQMIPLNNSLTASYKQYKDTNNALRWVGQQEDANGVVILMNWYYTGGYTYFHVNKEKVILNWNEAEVIILIYLTTTDLNYVIVPKYVYTFYKDLYHTLIKENWQLTNLFENTEVWKRVVSS